MGIYPAPAKCHITDMLTENRISPIDKVEYYVEFNNKRLLFIFNSEHINSEFVNKNKYILKGLLINGKFPFPSDLPYFNNDRLEKIISEAQIPRTPKSKLDSLMLYFYEHQDYAGAVIDLKSEGDWDIFLNKLYFKNHKEYWFFLNTLREQNLIDFRDTSSKDGSSAMDVRLTYSGLEYVIGIQEGGENSKYCFIAMSFSETASEIRKTIKKAVTDSGYIPLLVDEQHYESGTTINDAIIKFIKQSKFLVADFTDQKHGVYFEAGFALGLKRPVIYTCSASDFEKTHFDTNHYPHIVYDDMATLEIKLKDKIEAWIE